MNGVMGLVEDINPKGGGVALDRGGFVNTLEGVRELEEKQCGFREVLDLGGWGRRLAGPCSSELIYEAVIE
jgi:hypothetical protein